MATQWQDRSARFEPGAGRFINRSRNGGNVRKNTLFISFDQSKWGRRDSNSHASRRQILSLVRLPISPRPRIFF